MGPAAVLHQGGHLKAWFPLTRRSLDFEDADITISPANGSFQVRLLVTPPEAGGGALSSFAGRWMARDGLILTAITVSAWTGLATAPVAKWPLMTFGRYIQPASVAMRMASTRFRALSFMTTLVR